MSVVVDNDNFTIFMEDITFLKKGTSVDYYLLNLKQEICAVLSNIFCWS